MIGYSKGQIRQTDIQIIESFRYPVWSGAVKYNSHANFMKITKNTLNTLSQSRRFFVTKITTYQNVTF